MGQEAIFCFQRYFLLLVAAPSKVCYPAEGAQGFSVRGGTTKREQGCGQKRRVLIIHVSLPYYQKKSKERNKKTSNWVSKSKPEHPSDTLIYIQRQNN